MFGITNICKPLLKSCFQIHRFQRSKKESIDKRDADGWSPLLIASAFGHIESTDVLLSHNVEISTSDKNDQNVVYIASLEGQHRYLEHILAYSRNPADLVNARDVYHNTALHIAAQNGHIRHGFKK